MLGRVNILDICVLTSSDVTINEMEIKIATFFRKIERNQYCDFWSTCDSIPTPYHPRGTGDQHRRSQNGFKPPPPSRVRSCRVRRSLYPRLRILEYKNQNRIAINSSQKQIKVESRGNITIVTSLLTKLGVICKAMDLNAILIRQFMQPSSIKDKLVEQDWSLVGVCNQGECPVTINCQTGQKTFNCQDNSCANVKHFCQLHISPEGHTTCCRHYWPIDGVFTGYQASKRIS